LSLLGGYKITDTIDLMNMYNRGEFGDEYWDMLQAKRPKTLLACTIDYLFRVINVVSTVIVMFVGLIYFAVMFVCRAILYLSIAIFYGPYLLILLISKKVKKLFTKEKQKKMPRRPRVESFAESGGQQTIHSDIRIRHNMNFFGKEFSITTKSIFWAEAINILIRSGATLINSLLSIFIVFYSSVITILQPVFSLYFNTKVLFIALSTKRKFKDVKDELERENINKLKEKYEKMKV